MPRDKYKRKESNAAVGAVMRWLEKHEAKPKPKQKGTISSLVYG